MAMLVAMLLLTGSAPSGPSPVQPGGVAAPAPTPVSAAEVIAGFQTAAALAPPGARPASAAGPGGALAAMVALSAPRDLLESDDGRLRARVGTYTDCSGSAPVPRDVAAVDPCFLGRAYFVGHNPGVFGPLMTMVVGDHLTYHDGTGTARRYRIVAIHVMARNSGTLPLADGVAAQFQACEAGDGSVDRVLDAVAER